MISRSDHPLSSIQHVAFRKKGKANFWPQRQERWDGRNVPEGSGPAVARRAPTRDYKQGEGDPKTSPMPRAALWIRAAPAPCPLSPFLPNSHLTFILRPPKTRELPPFTTGWRVCLRAIPGHLMCVLHALLETHRWKGYTGERRICWGCFCLRPPLRARACLGAGGRLFCSLARSLGVGWRTVAEVRKEGARSRQNGAAEPEILAPVKRGLSLWEQAAHLVPSPSELFLTAWGENALADVFLNRDCFL